MEKPEDFIEVIISAQETIRHSQRRKIPKSAYAEYLRMCDAETYSDEDFVSKFERYMHPDIDPSDSDGVEDLEITPVKEPKP